MAANPAQPLVESKVVIDVWSDVMCPFCYLGDAQLSQAIQQFDHPDSVEVNYHSFQLRPDLPAGEVFDVYETVAQQHGIPVEQMKAANRGIAERGATLGLTYNFDGAMMTNTHKAHQLIHFAKQHGRQHEMVQRLFGAFFTESKHIGDLQVLSGLAAEVGLAQNSALEALESGAFEPEVEADLQLARQIGINGVPFFIFNNKYAVSGAQPGEVFQKALETSWNEVSG